MPTDNHVFVRELASNDISDNVVKLGWTRLEVISDVNAKSHVLTSGKFFRNNIVLILAQVHAWSCRQVIPGNPRISARGDGLAPGRIDPTRDPVLFQAFSHLTLSLTRFTIAATAL